MGNLIPFAQRFIAGTSTRTVSARKLYEFLEVKRNFSNWIKGRIEQYDFEENQDFISLRQNGRKPQGGRPTDDYYLTIDMAKELAMVERNEKGKQARRYFINCEKKLSEKLKQEALPSPEPETTLDSLIPKNEAVQTLEGLIYRSIKEPFPIRTFVAIENGKASYVKQLSPGEIIFNVDKLDNLFSSVEALKKDERIFLAQIASKQAGDS